MTPSLGEQAADLDIVILRKACEERDQLREQVKHCLERQVFDESEIESLRDSLTSISKNTCCDKCQEAAKVARAAIATKPTPKP